MYTPNRPADPQATAHLSLAQRLAGFTSQGKDAGAWPLVHAALAEGVRGGSYTGPGGLLELTGGPGRALLSPAAKNPNSAAQLWDASEQLSGPKFKI